MMNNTDFKKFYEKYRGFSIRLIRRFIENPEDVEDICQEVFANIYNMGEELDMSNERMLCGLVKTVTFNEVKDYRKKAYRKYECNIADVEYDRNLRSLSYEIDDFISGIEAGHRVKFIFQKLRNRNPINYEIYVRVKIYGIPPGSVAKQFNLKTNSVNNRVLRTRLWLIKEYRKLTKDD